MAISKVGQAWVGAGAASDDAWHPTHFCLVGSLVLAGQVFVKLTPCHRGQAKKTTEVGWLKNWHQNDEMLIGLAVKHRFNEAWLSGPRLSQHGELKYLTKKGLNSLKCFDL